jgi:outer membrane protein assembly factor BamB
LTEADENPQGAVTCVEAQTGKEVWKHPLPDAVMGRVVVDRWRVYFGCRDEHLYCLDRRNGELFWRRDLDGPVMNVPAVQLDPESEVALTPLYVVTLDGELYCLGPASGKVYWTVDLTKQANSDMEVISSPALEVRRGADGSETRRLYVAVTLSSTGRTAELYCFEDQLAPGMAE